MGKKGKSHTEILEEMVNSMVYQMANLYSNKLVVEIVQPKYEGYPEFSYPGKYIISESLPPTYNPKSFLGWLEATFGKPNTRGIFSVDFKDFPYHSIDGRYSDKPINARYVDDKAEHIITNELIKYAKLLHVKEVNLHKASQ